MLLFERNGVGVVVKTGNDSTGMVLQRTAMVMARMWPGYCGSGNCFSTRCGSCRRVVSVKVLDSNNSSVAVRCDRGDGLGRDNHPDVDAVNLSVEGFLFAGLVMLNLFHAGHVGSGQQFDRERAVVTSSSGNQGNSSSMSAPAVSRMRSVSVRPGTLPVVPVLF